MSMSASTHQPALPLHPASEVSAELHRHHLITEHKSQTAPLTAPSLPFPLGASSLAEARNLVRTLRARAMAWELKTREPGKLRGILGGPSGADVYRALTQLWNPETGRLDPSQKTIAKEAGWRLRTVRSRLARLQALGMITRAPRYWYPHSRNNRLDPSRRTDEYTLQPETHWKGYTSQNHDDAPDPLPDDLWGAPSPVLSPIDQAVREPDLQTKVALLELTPPIGPEEGPERDQKEKARIQKALAVSGGQDPRINGDFGPGRPGPGAAADVLVAGQKKA